MTTPRPLIAGIVIALSLTGSGYVRRTWQPPAAATTVTDRDGSRDRTLHGKARRRARQARP